MTIQIPLLSFCFSGFICLLSLFIFYEGLIIFFSKQKSHLFASLMLKIAYLFGKEDSYQKWMSATQTRLILKIQGLSVVVGGGLGFLLGILMILNTITHVVIR